MLYRIAGTLIGEPVQQLATTRTTSAQHLSAPLHSVVLMSPIGGLAPPSLLTAPTIAVQGGGDPVVGATFVATTGTTTGVVDTTTWQWYRDGVAIAGETGTTYVSTSPGDVGGDVDITVQQTVANGAGSDSATSNAITVLTLFTMDQTTGTRSSEAAAWDPRTSTFYRQLGDEQVVLDTYASSYTWTQDGGFTGSQTDNLDGSRNLEDGDAAAMGRFYAQSSSSIKARGTTITGQIAVSKDTTGPVCRVTLQGIGGGGSVGVQVRLSDGAGQVTTGAGTFTVTDGGDTWIVRVSYVTTITVSVCRLYFEPCRAATLGGALDNTLTGDGDVSDVQIETNDAGWLRNNDLRLLDDDLAALFEEARTNLISQSIDLSAWSAVFGGSAAVSAVVAPDGGIAYEVTDSDGTRVSGVALGVASTSATGAHAASVFVQKDAGVTTVYLGNGGGTINGGTVLVDIDTATGAAAVATGSATGLTVADAGDDWWRVSFIIDVATTGSLTARLYPTYTATVGGGADTSLTGTAAFWQYQVEEGSSPTSPIRTSGAAATRAAESCVLASASVPAAMLSGAWSYTWQPLMSSTELVAAGASLTHWTFAGGVNPVDGIQVLSSSTWRMRIGGTVEVAQAITFDALDEIVFEVDLIAGETTITGATTGNGTDSMSSGSGLSWGSGDITISPLNGVRGILHAPVAA